MIKKYLYLFFISFFAIQVMAQENSEKIIKGKIEVEGASPEGVHVLNLVNEKSTVSDSKGDFSILAKEDDLLVFSAVHLEYARKSISKKEFETGFVSIKLQEKITELEEVVVTEYTKINAKDLGIIDYTPKKYTPAERKLYTATSGGGILPIDPILNWISGRTKMLKKEILVEKREFLLEKLDDFYDGDFFNNTLKIPELYVDGFKYYVVEDADLATALNQKNKTRATFLLGKLAADFNEFLKDEN
ncbi:hypothetical protein [Flavobacterium sp. UBA6135]|uniref:hypothetical protein n=1 Tax=Flavobacterium sp. UBA6135 TaxID=1946553 RepID=UPI0025C3B1EA|nr:hypothetical protein [Flavobacterium sp. UBA6135]